MSDKLEALKAAALAATPQDIDTAQTVDSDGYMECPHCDGHGHVDMGNDYCNYDGKALGVIFYGIGDAHVKAEAYFREAKPAVVLELLAALEEKERMLCSNAGEYEMSTIDLIRRAEAAEQYSKARDAENQDLMLTVGRLRVERAELQQRLQQPIVKPINNIARIGDNRYTWDQRDLMWLEAIKTAGFKIEGE